MICCDFYFRRKTLAAGVFQGSREKQGDWEEAMHQSRCEKHSWDQGGGRGV